MRQSQSSDSSAGSYSSGGASSAASQDNAEALDALQQGDEGEDLAQNDKGALSVVGAMALAVAWVAQEQIAVAN